MFNYHDASTDAVNHREREVWWLVAKSYKLVHVLVVHVSHL